MSCILYTRKFKHKKNLTNLHFCRFDKLKVDEKLGLVDLQALRVSKIHGLANINIINKYREVLNQQEFDELNIDD